MWEYENISKSGKAKRLKMSFGMYLLGVFVAYIGKQQEIEKLQLVGAFFLFVSGIIMAQCPMGCSYDLAQKGLLEVRWSESIQLDDPAVVAIFKTRRIPTFMLGCFFGYWIVKLTFAHVLDEYGRV